MTVDDALDAQEERDHAQAREAIENAAPVQDFRAVARRDDPGTSWAAARSVTGIRESQRIVLSVLREAGALGLTDEVLVARVRAHHPMSVSGIRTRRAELVELGYVADSGRKARTAANRATIVWVAHHGSVAPVTVQAEGRFYPGNHALSMTPGPGGSMIVRDPNDIPPKPLPECPENACVLRLAQIEPTVAAGLVTGRCPKHGKKTVRWTP